MADVKLTMKQIGVIKTIAYHEGVSGGVKVYLQGNGEFFDDRHPEYYPEDQYYPDDDHYPCGCCTCCGCDCYLLEDDYEEDAE